jgi:hypothetical protein
MAAHFFARRPGPGLRLALATPSSTPSHPQHPHERTADGGEVFTEQEGARPAEGLGRAHTSNLLSGPPDSRAHTLGTTSARVGRPGQAVPR